MNILVTGGAGYIGAATARLLLAGGHRVVILDDLSRGHADSIPAGAPFYQGDIGDPAILRSIAAGHNIEACVHFAAFAYVGESSADPKLYANNNLCKSVSLMNSLVENHIRYVVFSSTCATYGEPQYTPIDEKHPQKPANFYGWTKLLIEQVLASYSTAYGLNYVALRYFNAAGALDDHGERHDPEPHLIPNILAAAAGGPSIKVFGNHYPTPDGTAIRDYIHIADLGRAHIQALRYLAEGGSSTAINLGTGNGFSVLEVIASAERVTGLKIPYEIAPARAGDPARLVACADRARELLKWEPEIPELDRIVSSAWNWQRRASR